MSLAATGPWTYPPTLPDDPKRLCLVELQHVRTGEVRYYVMRYLRNNWQFQERLKISPEQRVVRWALIEPTYSDPDKA
ncbi:MAG: hypothetical protein R2817_02575 [Flavobacteriales bacterium]